MMIQPNAERFIQLAVQPLSANHELRLAAEAELRETIAAHLPQDLTEACDALVRADAHPHRRRRWHIGLVIVMLMVSLPLLVHSIGQVRWLIRTTRSMTQVKTGDTQMPRDPNLTYQQELLFHGDKNATTSSERWKALWKSQPENPAYLAEYARAFFLRHDHLSPEILEAAERIDPDNTWFPMMAAASIAKESVKRRPKRSSGKDEPIQPPVWDILDEGRFQEALEAIHHLVINPAIN